MMDGPPESWLTEQLLYLVAQIGRNGVPDPASPRGKLLASYDLILLKR